MSKQVLFNKEAREKLLKGMDTVANAVAGTIGPKGMNVYIEKDLEPEITNDGKTIAASIVLEDRVENAGAEIVKNTSGQTDDDVGDGTSTTAVLVQALIHECSKRPENPVEIRRALKDAGDKVLKQLAKKAKKIGKEDAERVALISAEDKTLAKLISEIIKKLGEKAVINVEDSKTFSTEYEIVDGYEAKVGFMSPHFINDQKAGKAIYEDVPVLVSKDKISTLQDIAPLFEKFAKEGINRCVFVVEEIDDSILGVLVVNRAVGKFHSLVIRATGEVLEDIEGATGAKMVSKSTGVTFQNIELTDLGRAKKVVCDANKTLFIGNGMAGKLRAAELEKKADNEFNQYMQKNIRHRAAQLRGGVAVLKVGAPTDFERNFLKRKAEDAVKAVQAALEEGVVEGGGLTLWRLSQTLNGNDLGEGILKMAMTAPFRRIVENAGKDYTDIVRNMPQGKGYDAKTDEYVNMEERGIIDPVKVERCALENSISSASTFITTFATITRIPEKNEK